MAVIVPADVPAVLAAQEVGIPFVRIDTGPYGRASTEDREVMAYREIRECARNAAEIGLRVQAGGALDARNLERIAAVPEIEQVVVGRSLAARAVFCGLQTAVREMKDRLRTVRVEGEI
jgi:pyridoxine 5-phosphate synthase